MSKLLRSPYKVAEVAPSNSHAALLPPGLFRAMARNGSAGTVQGLHEKIDKNSQSHIKAIEEKLATVFANAFHPCSLLSAKTSWTGRCKGQRLWCCCSLVVQAEASGAKHALGSGVRIEKERNEKPLLCCPLQQPLHLPFFGQLHTSAEPSTTLL